MNPGTSLALAAALLFAGCASFQKKPPPSDMGEAPPEEAAAEPEPEPQDPPDTGATEPARPPDGGTAEPAKPTDVGATEPARPPEPTPEPPKQELPGSWTFRSAAGPGSAPVRHVDMEFGTDGAWCGSMLVEVEGKRRFQALDGTWTLADGKVTVAMSDGRSRTWEVSWDGGILVLKDGEAELRLAREAR